MESRRFSPLQPILFTVRLPVVLLWIVFGLVLLVCLYRWMAGPNRDRLNRWWSRWLLRWCGVLVRASGEPRLAGPALVAANHVSWLDIYVLSSVRATMFVGKAELRRWPILGWLIAGVGTIFIERGNRRDVSRVSALMNERFERGQMVGLFPEGTTSDGFDVLPFHASLFEAALRTGVAVQPVALRYWHAGRRSSLAAYAGDQTMLGSLWQVLGARGVEVEAVYLPVLAAGEVDDAGKPGRHALADKVRGMIRREVLRA